VHLYEQSKKEKEKEVIVERIGCTWHLEGSGGCMHAQHKNIACFLSLLISLTVDLFFSGVDFNNSFWY